MESPNKYLFKTSPFNARISFFNSASSGMSSLPTIRLPEDGIRYGTYICDEIYPVSEERLCRVD